MKLPLPEAYDFFNIILRKTQKLNLLYYFVALLLLGALNAGATHYRYGTISWQRVPGGGIAGAPCQIEVTVKQAWRTSAFFGGTPAIGALSGTTSTLVLRTSGGVVLNSANINLSVTSVNPADDWFFGEFKQTFTLNSCTDSFKLDFSNCCRISTLVNNSDDSFRSESDVTPYTSGNESPVSSQLPIVKVPTGIAANVFALSGSDPDGDPLTFRLATVAEAGAPGSFSHPDFSVSPSGMATFNSVGKAIGGLYNVWYAVEDTAGSKIIADFLIEIVGASTPPAFDFAVTPSPSPCFDVKPGDTVTFSVKADDSDTGSTVFLSAVGVPPGAMHTPTLPTSPSNPNTTTFFWIPDTPDIGTTVITYTAEDNGGVQTSTSICINVSLKPIFAVPPTPPQAVYIVAEDGDTVEFMAEAYDPSPADSVTIDKVNGKNMGGVKIPLYAGASFTPLPTPWGNPTSGSFFWIPVPSDWGARPVVFSAMDGFGEIAEHEVPILINNPPFFTTNGDTIVQTGDLYSYHVCAADMDTLFGDSLELHVTGAPAWLTFTDYGNGCGLLSGTPGPGDGGMYPLTISAEDVYHHVNGTATQMLTIEVIDTVPDTSCVVSASLTVLTDGSWMKSTVTTLTNLSGTWGGVGGALPPDASFTIPAPVGQPYSYVSIHAVPGSQVIKAGNNVTYYRKGFNMLGDDEVAAHIQLSLDDHAEIYLNGFLVAARYTGTSANFKNPPLDVMIMADGTVINPNGGGDGFDFITGSNLSDLLAAGNNTITVALRNYNKATDAGGFSLRMQLDYEYSTGACEVVDSCVSDSSWMLSTVVTTATANSYPWPGVMSVPPIGTFTLPVQVGQPYPWTHLYTVPGSEVIKSGSGVTYYLKTFELTDNVDINCRFRGFMDDNMQIFINGHWIVRENGMGPGNWRTANHDIMIMGDGTIHDGYMGGDPFGFVTSADMDTVLKTGLNTLVLAIRNRTSKPDVGGFSFRMDMDKGGVGVIKKSAAASAPVAAEPIWIDAYPNPTRSWVNVVVDNTIVESGGRLFVMDLNGKLLEQLDIDTSEIQVSFEKYSAGIYLLKVESGAKSRTLKVLRQ